MLTPCMEEDTVDDEKAQKERSEKERRRLRAQNSPATAADLGAVAEAVDNFRVGDIVTFSHPLFAHPMVTSIPLAVLDVLSHNGGLFLVVGFINDDEVAEVRLPAYRLRHWTDDDSERLAKLGADDAAQQ